VVASPPGAPKIRWSGPAKAKAGDVIELALDFDSSDPLRAASLQLAFSPAEFELVGIEDGRYFDKGNVGAFGKSIDAVSGRISVGITAPEGAPAKGSGKLALIKLRALKVASEASVGLIAFTPIGAEKAIPRPSLPLLHMMELTSK
jgi:general secretion pathway protein D